MPGRRRRRREVVVADVVVAVSHSHRSHLRLGIAFGVLITLGVTVRRSMAGFDQAQVMSEDGCNDG